MYKYKVRKIKVGITNKAKQEKYMPVGIRDKEIGLKQLAKQISIASSLTEGEVYSVLANLVTAMEQGLLNGDSIRLGPLGLFSLSLTGELCDRPDEVTPSKVRVSKLNFRPDPELKQRLQLIEFKREK